MEKDELQRRLESAEVEPWLLMQKALYKRHQQVKAQRAEKRQRQKRIAEKARRKYQPAKTTTSEAGRREAERHLD